MILRLKRTPGIYVVGFMGAGKTTVGRELAERLGWPFADRDDDIEADAGCRISEIFERDGEAAFRAMEGAALARRVRQIETGRPLVLALGGGAFAQEANYALVENNGITVWLDCPLEVVERRVAGADHRPLARDPERLRGLFAERQHAYAKADVRVTVESDDPAETALAILRMPIFQ